ncbi:MAG: alpha-glucan family phosphorylase [Opitutus sp.]
MSNPISAAPSPPDLPPGIEALTELAMNLRWSWNHASDVLWRRLDPGLWALTHHPSEVLQTVARDKLATALSDPDFCGELDRVLAATRAAEAAPAWFQKAHSGSALTCIAYFCMEYMLTEALPIYSGGLGNVAGDQLKAASDLGVPVVGVGLLYQHGYFRQVIDQAGAQQALYPYNDPAQMPITPVRQADGELLRLEIVFPGGSIWVRSWQVQVGRVKLYLLDTNDAANAPVHRGITSELYGGGPELRLKQEMLLGIGGWRLLAALGFKPEVCHLNEGHAAFAVLERARAFMQEQGQPFAVALAATRAGNIFTTHTAVAAGFDLFPPALIEQHLGGYAQDQLGISMHDLLAMGRRNPDDPGEPFNMAYLALRGSGAINGVSRLHGRVSRHLFAPLFPRWPENEVPIGHVTNGVHMPTWDSAAADRIWTEACGQARWLGATEHLDAGIRHVSDEQLWALRDTSRTALVEYAHKRVGQQMSAAGADAATVARTQERLNPGVLTLGFARRFATYKRPNLLLQDPARLLRILGNRERPVQLIIAGKAHPADRAGQALIREWTQFIRHSEGHPPVVFLADYDMLLAEHLVQGIDVWLNTPRRPWEACGTSGMKVLVNGGLNLSEMDGWWAEAYRPDVGWALGDGQEHGDDPEWDAAEADALYERLEQEVIPEFYARDTQNRPVAWLARIRESMARLTPRFAATRAVCDYTERHYLPAADAYRTRATGRGLATLQLVERQHDWRTKRDVVHINSVSLTTNGKEHAFVAKVSLGAVDSASVCVEVYANSHDGGASVQQEMVCSEDRSGASDPHSYFATVSSTRPATDYTVRILHREAGLTVPLEDNWILWQK